MIIIKQIFENDDKIIEQISNIEKSLLSEGWSKEEIKNSLKFKAVYFATFVDDVIVGHVGANIVLGEAYINNIAVKEEYQREGIGSMLVKTLIDFCARNKYTFLTLEVRESNVKAIRLYEKFGFVKQGSRKNFYSNPVESADIMTLYLDR